MKDSGSLYRYLSLYAQRLSSNKDGSRWVQRGDSLVSVTLYMVVGFTLSVAVMLTKGPRLSSFAYPLNVERSGVATSTYSKPLLKKGGGSKCEAPLMA